MLKRLTAWLLVLGLLTVCVSGATAAAGTLRKGSRGEEVTRLQNALKALGLYTIRVDGIYGKGTVAAVTAYQRKAGLKADGIAGPKTLGSLYGSGGTAGGGSTGGATAQQTAGSVKPAAASGSLRPGDRGEAVRELKARLRYIGCLDGEVNDVYDDGTRAAVIAFQAASRLTRDGIAGKKTLAALDTAWTAARKETGHLPEEAAVLLNRIRRESGAVNGTLVLTKDGKTILTWGFGGADPETCFRIASVTKWVTAIGLMTLVDRGQLDLDRDISDYLPFTVRNPAYPDKAITARMLLSHTSSLSPKAEKYRPDWERIGKNGYDPIFDESIEPGTRFVYADYNGALFGGLIEAITGESVQDYMNRTVFAPLGLTAAYSPKYLPAGTRTKDMLRTNGTTAISVQNDLNYAYNNTADPRANNGHTVGGLYISAASLTRLARMMLSGGELDGVRILNRETVSLMEADQPGLARSDYGLSNVRHAQFPRGTWFGHQGRYSGLTSNVYYQVDTGMTLALIMNGYDFQLENNIVMPAVTLLRNMEMLDTVCGTQQ